MRKRMASRLWTIGYELSANTEAWRRVDSGANFLTLRVTPAMRSGPACLTGMLVHLPEETERRVELATAYGE